jgi:uncharacterized membrane protein
MDFTEPHYLPVAPPAFALLAAVAALLLLLLQFRLLRYAYEQLGVSSGAAVFILIASLLGSYVNIPIATLGSEPVMAESVVVYFGVPYVVPHLAHARQVVLAVNVGGAVIPTVLSLVLLSRNAIWGRGLLAAACVAVICHAYAEPVRGVGIALPVFVGPLSATVVAALVAAVTQWRHVGALAYAGGSLGVLIGADLANLDRLVGIGAPVLSLGGAGTFDGIYMTGVLSVLLASLIGGRAATPQRRCA